MSCASSSFTLYEDEGDNYNYEHGIYATIPIQWNEKSQTLTIGARHGEFPGMLKDRTFNVVFVTSDHGVGIPQTDKPDDLVHYSGAAIKIQHG